MATAQESADNLSLNNPILVVSPFVLLQKIRFSALFRINGDLPFNPNPVKKLVYSFLLNPGEQNRS